MIEQLIEALQQAGLDLTDEEIADALWLAERKYQEQPPKTSQSDTPTASPELQQVIEEVEQEESLPAEPAVPLFAADTLGQEETNGETADSTGLPLQVPAATALPNAIALSRALRPLLRRVASQTQYELDEEATVEQIAAQRIRLPVVKPQQERWLDLELVIEDSAMEFVWRKTVEEFQKKVLERLGAFRNLRSWRLQVSDRGALEIWPASRGKATGKPRSPRQLMHPSGRRLILLVSDCSSPLWQQRQAGGLPTLYDWLERWSHQGPTAVVQLLPERLWEKTELGYGDPVQLSALGPGVANPHLTIDGLVGWGNDGMANPLTLPVVTLDAAPMAQWAKVVAGQGNQRTPGFWFDLEQLQEYPPEEPETALGAEARINRFFASGASPITKELTRLMAAAPVSLPVVYLIRAKLLPQARPIHVAEVYRSGLLEKQPGLNQQGEPIYDFPPEVRRRLAQLSDPGQTLQVFDALTDKIAEELGEALDSFDALLSPKEEWLKKNGMVAPFAAVAMDVLKAMGGSYRLLAETVEEEIGSDTAGTVEIATSQELSFEELEFTTAQIVENGSDWPALQQETVTVAEVVLEPVLELEAFEFTSGRLEQRQSNPLLRLLPGRREVTWTLVKQRWQGRQFLESLGDGLNLEMVALAGGKFTMGSPADEEDRYNDEGPQHNVTVAAFWMGKYPVTQAQWRYVAGLTQVDIELPTDPSEFKGNDRPVERVSWHEATEFCARLAAHTGRPYRLPTEAEWEYACRAGTDTPFHFGETITPEVANHNGNYTYGDGPKGKYREKTTSVGQFDVANRFGLYDMHGNVWEWCQDHWHDDYNNAPTNSSAWLSEDEEERRVLRGGSWYYIPRVCRSATRFSIRPGGRNYNLGFRVCCSPPGL